MKKSIAILLTMAMLLMFAACGAKDAAETTTTTETQTEADTTAAVETTAKEETSAEAEETTEAATIKAPSTKAEIIEAYNNAVNNAFDKQAGFNKERYTDNENYDMSLALKAFKGLVEKFVGIGEANKYQVSVTKGQWETDAKKHYLRQSTLTEADVKDATIKEENGNYVITLSIKDGNSVGSDTQKSTNAPLDKCGICVGNEDKGYYDHKTGEVIYSAISGTYAGAKIDENYINATAVAEINAETGELVSLTVKFNIFVNIDISIGKGMASGTTHV
ncbi:MAG: hypothetical protein MJ121_03545, partial [Clostridia bacterium]|nr:hypothetical protein [Clostridia bacterium]